MLAADIMTHPVFAIDPATPLVQAIRLMTAHRVSGLPVVDPRGEVVGMLTEGDLLRRVETGTAGEPPGLLARIFRVGRTAEQYVQTHSRLVGEVMTPHVISVAEGTTLDEVAELMLKHRIKRLPVVRDGRLVGIVSRADLVRRVGEVLSQVNESADDTATERHILAALDREPWSPGRMVTVVVKDGVVGLDGCLFDIRTREAIGVLAENAPGVKRVENRIVCIEPQTGTVTFDPAEDAAAAKQPAQS